MEQLITHACGHEQGRYLVGYARQQERKARWLQTTNCRTCFVAGKKAAQADAAVRDSAVIAHLDLPMLAGSDRQVVWATTICASRLATSRQPLAGKPVLLQPAQNGGLITVACRTQI